MTNYSIAQLVGRKWVYITEPMSKKDSMKVLNDVKRGYPFQKFKLVRLNKGRKK